MKTDTTASKRGRTSRNKGKVGEREVANLFRAEGFPRARRGVQNRGSSDSPDVDVPELPDWQIEVKRTERFSLYPALEQAQRDGPGKNAVVFHRQNEKPWVVVMSADTYFKLMRRELP